MKILSTLTLIILTSCGAVQNSCDIGGYNELCYGLLGDKPVDGSNGIDGKDGVDDKDGQNCTVTENDNGAIVTCGSSVVQISNGEDAVQSPYAIEKLIDPCGDFPGYADEIIIKTHNGELIVYFEDGGRRFLSSLTPGNYQTTDRQRCNFRVTSDMEVEEI